MNDKKAMREIIPLPVRMPAAMRERVQASAVENRRSLNSEILIALERQYPAQETTKGSVSA